MSDIINETLIDEGIIPMNLGWRAGISVPKQQSINPITPNPYGGITPPEIYMANNHKEYGMITDSPINSNPESVFMTPQIEKTVNTPKSTPEFCSTLTLELETHLGDIADEFKNAEINAKTIFDIKTKIKEMCHFYMSRYKNYIDSDFISHLYQYCNTNYQAFTRLDPTAGALSEVIKLDDKLYINPLLIYQYFQI